MGDPHVANAVPARPLKLQCNVGLIFQIYDLRTEAIRYYKDMYIWQALKTAQVQPKRMYKKNRTILTFDPAKENIFVGVLRLRVTLRQKSPLIEEFEFYY